MEDIFLGGYICDLEKCSRRHLSLLVVVGVITKTQSFLGVFQGRGISLWVFR